MRSVRDQRHDRAAVAGQPRGDVAVVVQAYRGDFPGPYDLGPLIVGHPQVWRLHACLLDLTIALAYMCRPGGCSPGTGACGEREATRVRSGLQLFAGRWRVG